MLLAIDTATKYAGLALYNQDGLYAEEAWYADRNHTIELMPRIVRMLQSATLPVAALAGVAVSLGPGSFTGLRIGLAAAKGMALPHQLPLVGVPTLETVAYPLRTHELPVWAIVQAGRGRILAACYQQSEDGWGAVSDIRLTDFHVLASQIKKPALCAGEINAEAAQTLRRVSRDKAVVLSPAARLRRAGYLAELAAARLAEGDRADPDRLSPIYASSL